MKEAPSAVSGMDDQAITGIASQKDSRATPRLAILACMNRSGSTFLAKELDRLEAVRATLEANFPFDEAPGQALSSSKQVEGYLDALFADRKFGAWQLSRAAVKAVNE